MNQPPPDRVGDPSRDPQPNALSCMEIWGGNEALDSAVTVPGIDAWAYSRPHGPAFASEGGDVHYVLMCDCSEIGRFFTAEPPGDNDVDSIRTHDM